MKLTKRLTEIINFAAKGKKVCDIGCDHGIVGIELITNHNVEFVIFSDILLAPLSSAVDNVKAVGIDNDKVAFRVGDGLTTIEIGEVDTVIITGMGGKTIIDILSADLDKTRSYKYFILQPTNGERILRQWLCENCFVITDETLVEDNDIYYETFAVSHGKDNLSEKQIKFGKHLNYNDKIFVNKYKQKLDSLENIKNQIPDKYDQRIAEFNKEIVSIKEILKVGDV